jgi:hypothetical protein
MGSRMRSRTDAGKDSSFSFSIAAGEQEKDGNFRIWQTTCETNNFEMAAQYIS